VWAPSPAGGAAPRDFHTRARVLDGGPSSDAANLESRPGPRFLWKLRDRLGESPVRSHRQDLQLGAGVGRADAGG